MSNFQKIEQKLNELKSQFPHDEYIEKRARKNTNLKIIGITGSNGKTTTALIVHEYLKSIGLKSVLFASCGIDLEISNYDKNSEVDIPIFNETSLINAIDGAIKERADYLILEINERTIEKGYIEGIPFSIRALTNIVPKHNTLSHTNLIMPFNALNITLAYAILDSLGEMEDSKFNQLLEEIKIPGRDEVIKYNGRTIIISVTCTPHLEILKRYKENNKINNIILITGSFGNGFNSWLSEYKDENFKNYVNESMRWAYSYFIKNADKIYITTNDYASSNVSELLKSQENEIKGKIAYEVIENRKVAIKKAIEESEEGDVIFISGRGNRKVFCNNTKSVEMYLDKEIVNKEIREKDNAN